jgi:hypothetical protein
MNLVISQSMFFPWIGFIQLVNAADTYVRYDDVKFSKGSFTNRVQIRTKKGKTWLTLPVGSQDDRPINKVDIRDPDVVFARIRAQVIENYRAAQFVDDAVSLIDLIQNARESNLSEIAFRSTMELLKYFGIEEHLTVTDVCQLKVGGNGSDRVLEICQRLGAKNYLSATGGVKYLAHQKFQDAGVTVKYPRYNLTPWKQIDKSFDPYVSALDVVANCGSSVRDMLETNFQSWRDLVEPAT